MTKCVGRIALPQKKGGVRKMGIGRQGQSPHLTGDKTYFPTKHSLYVTCQTTKRFQKNELPAISSQLMLLCRQIERADPMDGFGNWTLHLVCGMTEDRHVLLLRTRICNVDIDLCGRTIIELDKTFSYRP